MSRFLLWPMRKAINLMGMLSDLVWNLVDTNWENADDNWE